jgi:hypothetical protein
MGPPRSPFVQDVRTSARADGVEFCGSSVERCFGKDATNGKAKIGCDICSSANATSRAQTLSSSGALSQALQNVLLADWLKRSSNAMANLSSWQTCPILSRTQSPAFQSQKSPSSSCRHLVRATPAITYTTSGAGSIQSAANH